MKLSCSSIYTTHLYSKYDKGICIRYPSLEEILEYIEWSSEEGFQGFELGINAEEQIPEIENNLETIKKWCLKLNIQPFSIELVFFANVIINNRIKSLKLFRRFIKLARRLDCPLIYMNSPLLPGKRIMWPGVYTSAPPQDIILNDKINWDEIWNSYTTIIKSLSKLAKEAGIKLAIQPRPREIISNTDSALRLIDKVGLENLGVILDTSHLFAQKEIIPISIYKLGKYIFGVHLSDNDGTIEYHWPPGEGKIRWYDVLFALRQIGYNGFLSIEVGGLPDIKRAIKNGKEYIQGILKSINVRI